MSTMSPALKRLLEAAAARKQASLNSSAIPATVAITPVSISTAHTSLLYQDTERGITYNEKQSEAINFAKEGKSFVLVGAAGTGKTTCMKGAMNALIQSGIIPPYHNDGHKHLKGAVHGIVISAFTRRAVANIKKNLSHDMQGSCVTVHAALEYAPTYYDVQDPVTLEYRTTMQFVPTRTKDRPLPESIKFCIIEESSMLGVDLFKQLQEALPPGCRFIFLGDIQQLPPVFGSAILGFKMLELPVVELTEVYRQALDSPIISLAHRILSGVEMPLAELKDWTEKYSSKGLSFHPIAKRVHAEHILPKISAFLKGQILKGLLNPETDVVLTPFNKALGTLELNKEIADFLTKQREAITYEIIAGFNKHYYAVGDKVLYEKEDAEIISISRNGLYYGSKIPMHPSKTLDRWGFDSAKGTDFAEELSDDDFSPEQVDAILNSLATSETEAEERKNEASHTITIRMLADDTEITLNKSAEINNLLLGYCLTVHKAQGSEWRKVYCIFHQSHNTMIARELLYTAVTRAREELYVICEPDTFTKGITRQKVPGNTIEAKAEFFKGKKEKGDY